MPKSRGESGEKNLIADRLRQLREERGFSQRKLAMEFQLMGLDIDRNVITRIETKQRYVTDIELCAIMKVFQVSSEELLNGWEEKMQFIHTPEGGEADGAGETGRKRKAPGRFSERFSERGRFQRGGTGIRKNWKSGEETKGGIFSAFHS